MTRQDGPLDEFHSYLGYCTEHANFKFIETLPTSVQESGRALMTNGENLLALYENEPDSDQNGIWISDAGLYWNSDDGLVTMKYEDMRGAGPVSTDQVEGAFKDPALRYVQAIMKDGRIFQVPFRGLTNGALDLLKVGFLVADAIERQRLE